MNTDAALLKLDDDELDVYPEDDHSIWGGLVLNNFGLSLLPMHIYQQNHIILPHRTVRLGHLARTVQGPCAGKQLHVASSMT